MSTINGRKPISSKQKPSGLNLDAILGNGLGLDPKIVEACKAKNLAYRFISFTKLSAMGGYHERGWRPITRKELGCDTMDAHSFQLGASPDGLIRRGDLVLAVRPTEINDYHKAYLAQEAQRSTASVSKKHAEEIRKKAAAGVNIREGYEETEQDA